MKEEVIDSGFAGEIDWQEQVASKSLTASVFLREAAWVVLSAGFRDSVVRRVFPGVAAAFMGWEDLSGVRENLDDCRKNALVAFGNRRKIDAIAAITQRVCKDGFSQIKKRLDQDGITFLQELPFIGPVTSLHLAKNLGMPVAKPDRHLVRIAEGVGYDSAQELCNAVSEVVGDPVPVVDIVAWRYVTLKRRFMLRLLDRIAIQ